MSLSYLASLDFVSLAFLVLTCFEVPVHVFGAYCILFKTPKNMRSVKWTLFNLHVWCTFSDLGLSCLVAPYVLYPAAAGVPLGVLSRFGVPELVQLYLCISLLAAVAVAVLTLFENRYFLLFAFGTTWSYCRVPFLVCNYILAFVHFLPICFRAPDQKIALLVVFRELPLLPTEMYHYPIYVFSLDAKSNTMSSFSFSTAVTCETAIFFYLIFAKLRENEKRLTLSRYTFRMQKQFFRAVQKQISIPFIGVAVPCAYLSVSAFSNYYNQSMNNLSLIVFAMHGLASTITMLLIHTGYRDFCLSLLRSKRLHCIYGSLCAPKTENTVNYNVHSSTIHLNL